MQTSPNTGTYSVMAQTWCPSMRTSSQLAIRNITVPDSPTYVNNAFCLDCPNLQNTSQTITVRRGDVIQHDWVWSVEAPDPYYWIGLPYSDGIGGTCQIVDPQSQVVQCLASWQWGMPFDQQATATPVPPTATPRPPTFTPTPTATAPLLFPPGGPCGNAFVFVKQASPGVALIDTRYIMDEDSLVRVDYRIGWLNRRTGASGIVIGSAVAYGFWSIQKSDVVVTGSSFPTTILASVSATGTRSNGSTCSFFPNTANGLIP